MFRLFAARAESELRRLRAESAVRESEQSFSRLFDSAMDAIIELNNEFIVERANLSAASVFDVTAVAMAGRRFDEFLTSESAQKLRGLAADLVCGAQANSVLLESAKSC